MHGGPSPEFSQIMPHAGCSESEQISKVIEYIEFLSHKHWARGSESARALVGDESIIRRMKL